MPAAHVEIGHLLAAAPDHLIRLGRQAQPEAVEGGIMRRHAQFGMVRAEMEGERQAGRCGFMRGEIGDRDAILRAQRAMAQCDAFGDVIGNAEIAAIAGDVRRAGAREQAGRAGTVGEKRARRAAQDETVIDQIKLHGADFQR